MYESHEHRKTPTSGLWVYRHLLKVKHINMPISQGDLEMWQLGGKQLTGPQLVELHKQAHYEVKSPKIIRVGISK